MWLALVALIALSACNNLDDEEVLKPVDPPVVESGNGTLESPYSITQAIKNQGETAKWVEGYIIGAINTTNSNDFVWEYAAPFGTSSNLLIAATPDERDQKNILVVQLPVGAIRDALNLVSNSSAVLGKKVKLLGDLTAYFGKPGLKNPTEFKIDGFTPPEPPVVEGGTKEDPFTVAEAIVAQGQTGKWVKGFIIGSVNTVVNPFVNEYAAPFATNSNLILAVTADERNESKMLMVQLPVGAVRDALNLVSNPSVLGKEVSLLGDLASYFSKPGLKNVTLYELDGVAPTETIVSFTSNPVTSVQTGAAYSYNVVVSVTNPKGATTIAATGIPAWASFKDNNDGTATITGTAPATVESSNITLTASNNGVTKEQTFTLNVTKPVAPGVNLLANGNFEDWTGEAPASWSFKAVTGVTYEKNTQTVQSSTNSIKVVSSATSATAGISANRVKLTPGNYVYTFYYYIDPAVTVANTFRAWGMTYDNETTTTQTTDAAFNDMKKLVQPTGYVDASVKGQWVKNEIAFTVPKDCYMIFDVRFYKGTTGYIDSVSLIQQ